MFLKKVIYKKMLLCLCTMPWRHKQQGDAFLTAELYKVITFTTGHFLSPEKEPN